MRGIPSPSPSPGQQLNVAGTQRGGRQWPEGCRGRAKGEERSEREPSVKVNKKHTQTDEKLCRALKRDSGVGGGGQSSREEGTKERGTGGSRTACCLLSVANAVTNEQTADDGRTDDGRTEARQAKRATLIRHVVRGLSRQHAQCNGIFMLHHVAVISHV